MLVKCFNCGIPSPDVDEYLLISKFKWMALGNFIPATEYFSGKEPELKWFCKTCSIIGFDMAFGLPARILDRRN